MDEDELRRENRRKLLELNNFRELNKVNELIEKIVAQETGVERPGCVTTTAISDAKLKLGKYDIKISVSDTKGNLEKINNRLQGEFGEEKDFYSSIKSYGGLLKKDKYIEIAQCSLKKSVIL